MRFQNGVGFIYGCLVLGCAGWLSGQEPELDFARDILPIFSNQCFVCHGPDQQTRESGFRLDQMESAMGEADSGEHPIVPGDLGKSEIVRRILSTDTDQMPPGDSDQSLTADEKELIQRWIRQGAPWAKHWAFVTPKTPELPQVARIDWPRNEIDRFVLAKLESKGLAPSAEAPRETLIRRLSLDLIGIPPTPEQVDSFLQDPSPDAYEKLVDRLLASPHYGEHMATAWLDAARFADTNGYQNDFARSMWPWRDWVISAFNENMPFDRFTIQQLAGDLLPNPTDSQKIATGFNRNHRTVTEGGSIDSEWHVENLVDRVETTSTVFLGLTMGCARCHDHKYDPITQREFYQLFAFFNSINEKGVHNEKRGNVPPLMRVESPQHKDKLDKVDRAISTVQLEIESIKESLADEQAQWESHLSESWTFNVGQKHVAGWLNSDAKAKPESVARRLVATQHLYERTQELTGPAIQLTPAQKAPISLGDVFDFDGTKPFSVNVWVKPKSYGAIFSRMDAGDAYRGFDMLLTANGQIEVHLIHHWPDNGLKIQTLESIPKMHWSQVALTYDGSGKAAGIKVYFNNRLVKHAVKSDTLDGTTLTDHAFWVGQRGHSPSYGGLISDVRIFDTCLSEQSVDFCFGETLIRAVKVVASERTPDQQSDIDYLFISSRGEKFADAKRNLNRLKADRRALEQSTPTVMIMEEMSTPRETFVLRRGQYDQPIQSDPVTPGFPKFLPAPSETGQRLTRLDLAHWITDRENPLTARVTVNRFWNRIFGAGILETIENIGVQSPPPSHHDLLDWLAVDFIESGWDVKRMLKQIVTSATYRQTSAVSSAAFADDPVNRWFARGSRYRLPAESIRDNALAISGLLESQVGGPSMKPYQPKGLWQELAGGAGEKPYVQDTDRNLYRRSLYIYRKRTVPHPTMSTFDGAARDVCQVARQRTNTPLQALALLNDRTYAESARQLATRVIGQRSDKEERMIHAFRIATSRRPSPNELKLLLKSLERSRDHFRQHPDAAQKFVSVGESKIDSSIDVVELAAWSVVASVILNLDETITRE